MKVVLFIEVKPWEADTVENLLCAQIFKLPEADSDNWCLSLVASRKAVV